MKILCIFETVVRTLHAYYSRHVRRSILSSLVATVNRRAKVITRSGKVVNLLSIINVFLLAEFF